VTDDDDPSDARLLQKTTQEVFAELFPSTRVRELMATDSGWDRQTWKRLTGELGIAGLMIDEDLGGSGLSARELGLVFEEAGRCLGAAPLFAVAGLAIPLLISVGDDDAREALLPKLCDGSLIATVMYADGDGRWGPSHVDVQVQAGRLHGGGGFVVDAGCADLIFIPVREAEGLAVYAVERDAAGVDVVALVPLDQTRKQARVTLTGARGVRLGDGADAVQRGFDTSCALLACELTGVAARCLEMTTDYARDRVQFGRRIGSFQAVKQKLAEALIQVESARSAATAAASAAADRGTDLWWTASLAKAYCSEAAMHVAEETIQLHGGIGFTWEHDAHLFFKRARTGEEMLGSAREHYDRVGTHLSVI
jgi:alkylation response protein AidB-like acyl-CoA dehydrogenase